MGVSIRCKKTGRVVDMAYSGFNRLRNKIAELAGEPFGSHYKKLDDAPYCYSKPSTLTAEERGKLLEAYNAETQRIIDEKRVSVKVVDFCMQSDCKGRIRYGACKELLKVIGGYDGAELYGQAEDRFAEFKATLQDCVDTKSDLTWD